MSAATPSPPASWSRPLAVAVLAAVACLASLLFYEGRFAAAERGRQRVTVLFRTADLETPLALLPSPLPGADRLEGGQLRVVPTEAQKGAGVRTDELQRNAVCLTSRVFPHRDSSGAEGYVAPGLAHDPATGTARPLGTAFRRLAMAAATLLAGTGAFLLASAAGRLRRAFLGLAALRLASLSWFFGLFGFFSTFFEDERIYRATAEHLLHGGTQLTSYRFPVGLPLLYTPLLALVRDPDPRFFAMCFSLLSFATLGLAALGGTMLLLNRAGLSSRASAGGGLAVVLYPWLMSTVMKRAGDGVAYGSFPGLLSFVPSDANWPIVRMFSSWAGYSAMSDTPALAAGVLGLALVARRPTPRRLFLAGLVLGFGFLVRVMNVFYLAPAALLLAEEDAGRAPRAWAALGAGFLAAAAPQFLWNAAIFGSPWTFGYKFAPGATYRGFEWSSFADGVAALSSAHFQLLALGAAALLLVGRRAPRCASLVAVLAGPTLFYYCGYYFVLSDPVRLTLMPLLLLLMTLGAALAGDGRERAMLLVATAAALAYSPGLGVGPLFAHLPRWLPPVAYAGLAGLAAWRLRDWVLPAALLVLASGSGALAAAALAGAILWVAAEALLRIGRTAGAAPGVQRISG